MLYDICPKGIRVAEWNVSQGLHKEIDIGSVKNKVGNVK